jgi:uncharacterized protein YegJ (DUF2314 family)
MGTVWIVIVRLQPENTYMAYELDNLDGMKRLVARDIIIGDSVKLVFRGNAKTDGYAVERMWVKVLKFDRGKIIGKLDNDPYEIIDLKSGDIIEFNSNQVLEIFEGQ